MKRLFLLFLFCIIPFLGFSQDIYVTDNIDEVLYRDGISLDFVFSGISKVFYKEQKDSMWHYLTERHTIILINDTLGYWSVILDNESSYDYTVYEYTYREVTWDDEMRMCFAASNFWGIKNGILCIDNNSERNYVITILREHTMDKEWFMYILEYE